jgi:hypothetical protein
MQKLVVPAHPRESGQGFVEFAISLVFLLILLAGLVDLGRMFYVYIALREAAQEGAQYGALCPNGLSIETRVRQSSDFPIDLSDPQVAVNSSVVAAPGTPLRVEVKYLDFQLIMPFIGTVLGTQNIEIRAQANAVVLQQTCP